MDSNKLFSPVGATKEEKTNTEQYKVSFKEGKNGVYRSVIRFIPNFADPSKSTMIKSVSWVKNPITQKGMYVDDPRSVGQPSPVTDMYFNLYNNIWNTNFPMWFSDDAKFRFVIRKRTN
jgi:hypothetical protein